MQYITRKIKKSNNRRKVVVFFIVIATIFAFFGLYMKFLVTPLIVQVGRAQIKLCATKSINYAITQAMSESGGYDDLITIVSDESGKISLIEANAIRINTLSMDIERLTLQYLLKLSGDPINIPLGAFTGIPLFSGLGPKVSIDIYPYGDVGCKFLSQFISAGINQTQHKIYALIEATINVVLPFKTISVKTSNEIMVCESLIIGQIPDTYLNSDSLSDMLDLVPNR